MDTKCYEDEENYNLTEQEEQNQINENNRIKGEIAQKLKDIGTRRRIAQEELEGGNLAKKYIKYKNKYLNLKNKIINSNR